MKPGIVRWLAFAACAVLSSAALVPAATYQIVDLGTLGGSTSKAASIAWNGSVAGDAKNASSAQHAVVWEAGGIVDLGVPRGYAVSTAVAVNDSGQAAVTAEADPQAYGAFLRDGHSWISLGVLPGRTDSIASGIDSAGRIAGTSFTVGAGDHRAFLWDGGALTDLGTLGGATRAQGINDAGQITGYSYADLPGGGAAPRAFVWENGVLTELGLLAGETHALGLGISELGDVAGSCYHITGSQLLAQNRATLWAAGGTGALDLGPTPGPDVCVVGYPFYTDNVAREVNDCGQVVGHAECVGSGGPLAAFLWEDGVMSNLEDLIPAGSGWSLLTAEGVNDAGRIVGIGLNPAGELHAFMLVPPAPPACGLRALEIQPEGLSWKAEPGALAYDVVAGDLETLHARAGDYAAAVTACLADGHPTTSLAYTADPAPGNGTWILVRAVTSAGPGTYDDASQTGSRDPGINASASACP